MQQHSVLNGFLFRRKWRVNLSSFRDETAMSMSQKSLQTKCLFSWEMNGWMSLIRCSLISFLVHFLLFSHRYSQNVMLCMRERFNFLSLALACPSLVCPFVTEFPFLFPYSRRSSIFLLIHTLNVSSTVKFDDEFYRTSLLISCIEGNGFFILRLLFPLPLILFLRMFSSSFPLFSLHCVSIFALTHGFPRREWTKEIVMKGKGTETWMQSLEKRRPETESGLFFYFLWFFVNSHFLLLISSFYIHCLPSIPSPVPLSFSSCLQLWSKLTRNGYSSLSFPSVSSSLSSSCKESELFIFVILFFSCGIALSYNERKSGIKPWKRKWIHVEFVFSMSSSSRFFTLKFILWVRDTRVINEPFSFFPSHSWVPSNSISRSFSHDF